MLKVAILDNNERYLQRLHDYWGRTYGDFGLMVYAFSEKEHLMRQMGQEMFDILLVGSTFETDWESASPDTFKIFLLAGGKDGEVDGIPALAKNGNADELYSKMVKLYESHINMGKQTLSGKLVFFTSAEGGCGTSSCAVGYGKYLALQGKRVLYLNLELASAQEAMLDGNNEKTMDDLFYLCETDRKNVDHSIKTLVARDSTGLQFILPCRNPLELQEKSGGDIRRLLAAVTEKGLFDAVIVDRGFVLDDITDALIDLAEKVVLVAGEGEIGKRKQERTMVLLQEMNRRGLCITIKLKLLRNKAEKIAGDADNVLGSIPEWKDKGTKEVTGRMSCWQNFENLLEE